MDKDKEKGLLVLGITLNKDIVKIGDDISIFVKQHTGKNVRICIYAPKTIKVSRLMNQVQTFFNQEFEEGISNEFSRKEDGRPLKRSTG